MTSLQADPTSGLMRGARQLPSPNHDARPAGAVPELIVVHGISLPPGEFGGPWIDRLFTNTLPADAHPYFAEVAGLTVSSHLCIARDGAVTQYVSFNERAWHAGRSSYAGRGACNDFSIGIELEGADTVAYEAAQYRALADAVAALCAATAISRPGVKRIRARRSIGRRRAGSSPPPAASPPDIIRLPRPERLQSPSLDAGLP
jgi:AmpD protein